MYSELQWTDLGKYITQYIRQTSDPDCSEIRITYRNIIFNEEIKDIHRKLPSKNIRKFLQLLNNMNYIRRDIYFRKINHVPNNFEEVMGIRRKAHLKSVMEKSSPTWNIQDSPNGQKRSNVPGKLKKTSSMIFKNLTRREQPSTPQ